MASELITIEKPGPPAIVAELSPLVAKARAFEVVDLETDRIAQERGAQCRRGEKGIEEHFARAKKAASDAHKMIVASVNALIGPIAEARAIYFAKSDAFQREERRRAEEESRRLQALARKEEEERQIAAAIEAEASGEQAVAEAIMQEEVVAPVVTVAPQVAKVEGVSTRTVWSAKVTDVRTCLRFLLERDEWGPLLERCAPILETGLRPLAIAQHEALNIPGVRAVDTTSRSTR